MKFGIIAELAKRYPAKAFCQMLQVSRSGSDAWRKRGPSQRQQENEQMLVPRKISSIKKNRGSSSACFSLTKNVNNFDQHKLQREMNHERNIS